MQEDIYSLIIRISVSVVTVVLFIVFSTKIMNLASSALEDANQQILELYEDNSFESIDI